MRANFTCGEKDGDTRVFCRVTSSNDPEIQVGEIVASLNGYLTKPMTDSMIQDIMRNEYRDSEIVPAALYKQFELKFNCRARNGFWLQKEQKTGFFVIKESTNPQFQNGQIIESIGGVLIRKKTQAQVDKLCMTADLSKLEAKELSQVLAQQNTKNRNAIKRKMAEHEQQQTLKKERAERDSARIARAVVSGISNGTSTTNQGHELFENIIQFVDV
jgi:hypothetical protein